MTAGARRLAVLGSPIAHSRSPQLHLAAYGQLGLDWTYQRIEADEAGLDAFLAQRTPDWRGLSLTMPLKSRAFQRADDRDRIAVATGVANTLLLRDDGSIAAFNTDVAGLVAAIGEADPGAVDEVVVLGAGATAVSAVAAAAGLGARHVRIAARRPERAGPVLSVAADLGLTASAELITGGAVDAGLVISTLPGGAELPAGPVLPARAGTLLFDVAYHPWPTVVAAEWEAAGGRVASGLGMLVHQALVQVRIFVSGDPAVPLPDEDAVLAAMLRAVR